MIPKPGPKPKKPRKALKRTAIKASATPKLPKSWGKVRLPKTNPERKRERHMRDFDGGIQHDHFVRARGCALSRLAEPCNGSIQAAHVVKTRGAGGNWTGIVGLCNAHHRMQEAMGTQRIREVTTIDLVALAKHYVLENLREKGAI